MVSLRQGAIGYPPTGWHRGLRRRRGKGQNDGYVVNPSKQKL
jgi:hypothetical protein